MDSTTQALMTVLPMVIAFLLVLAVLWFLLPFAVFGIKGRMQRIEDKLEQTNQLLADIARRQPPPGP